VAVPDQLFKEEQMQRSFGRMVGAVLLLALLVFAAGCGGSDDSSEAGSTGGSEAAAGCPPDSFNFYVATPPSGGGAIAAENISGSLSDSGVFDGAIQTEFRPGGSGTVGFTVFSLEQKGADDAVMLALPSLISNPVIQEADVSWEDFTPIAQLFSEYDVFTVQADSDIQNLDDLAAAMKANPEEVRFFGGSVGSADHILVAKFAKAAGVPVEDVIYVGEAGGDTQVAQLLGGHTDVLVGGTENLDLVDAGEARALAVSSPERLGGSAGEVPTFVEQGYEVEEGNWRSVVGPPDMPEAARECFINLFEEMTQTSEWEAALEKNFWAPTTAFGDDFEAFLAEQAETRIELLKELGLIE
jgi:putative tricarboxylic transport membrane protein